MMRAIGLVLLVVALVLLSLPAVLAGKLSQMESRYPNIVPPDLEIGMYGTDAGQIITPRGSAYDSLGRLYVADCGNHRVQVFSPDGKPFMTMGAYGTTSGRFICPTGVAVHRSGLVFVSDSGNERIQVFSTTGRFVRAFGKGPQVKELQLPYDIAVTDTRVIVTSPTANLVYVYDLAGQLLFRFGGPGSRSGEFARPTGVALDREGNIYVADMYNNRIQKFTPEGRWVLTWGQRGSYNGQLGAPADLAITPSGELFVADSVNHRIQVFDTQGRYLYQFGRHPIAVHEGRGRLHYPMVLAATTSGSLLAVCEKFESRCQVFDTQKARRAYRNVNQTAWWEKYPYFHYRSPVVTRPPNDKTGREYDVAVIAEEELHRVIVVKLEAHGASTLLTLGTHGSASGQLNMANGATLDSNDNIWMADTMNHRIQVFSWRGKFLRTIGGPGAGPEQFNEPGAIQISSNGIVHVADAGNNRIQVLDESGRFLHRWGTYGTGDGQMVHPIYIALDKTESRIYVLDVTPRIQVFTVDGKYLGKWGGYGIGPGQFKAPLKIGVGPDGAVYVSDEALNRITKFSPGGKVLAMWGRRGSGPGEFYLPQGVAVDSHNRVWVIDYGNHRGQTFTADGSYLFEWGAGEINTPTANRNPADLLGSASVGVLLGATMVAGIGYLRRRGNGRNGHKA